MPPFDKTKAVSVLCEQCGNLFKTKRPTIAKYCSSLCSSRARPKRKQSPEDTKRRREKRLQQPGYREAETAKAHARFRRVKDWLVEYKMSKGCVDCGYNKHFSALDIDHVNGKTSHIHKLKSIKAIQAEIKKHDCVVRCANCHRIKSYNTKAWEKKPDIFLATYEPVDGV